MSGVRHTVGGVNRTDRLYAIVEDLRAIAPGRRSARQLAEHYEVSVRTIERDVGALQQAGVPVYAEVGRRGGYAVDKSLTLPPLNFTPAEAVAVSVALRSAEGSPFGRAARSALRKIVAAMPAREALAARELADRVRFLSPADAVHPPTSAPPILEEALVRRRVLRLAYRDKHGTVSDREVEPVMFLACRHGWYLFGWCRLRQDMRAFRLDRVVAAYDAGQSAPPRAPAQLVPCIPDHIMRSAMFG
jgi:predicted DNA-binding transcriptional regulator YafY